MSTNRVEHSAILLPNGKVLVPGGEKAIAEVFDPATGIWTPTSPMNAAQDSLAAVLLTNGKVLVPGVDSSGGSMLYDWTTDTWTNTGSLNLNPAFHAMVTLLANGKVLLVPQSVTSPIAKLYDPATGMWSNTTPPFSAPFFSTATLLRDGRVLLAGGEANQNAPAYTQVYDPATETWTLSSALFYQRYNHTATRLQSGLVLLCAGHTNDLGPGGITTAIELWGTPDPNLPLVLSSAPQSGNASYGLNFAETPGTQFSILESTDLNLPTASWPVIGYPDEISPGQFQFTDPATTNGGQKFYRVRSP